MKRVGTGVGIAALLLTVALFLGRHDHAGARAPMKPGAADFTVTSAADAGPGTLRDAILAADRLAESARISITTKRITLESALPALVNPHGITIEAAVGTGSAAGNVIIDAGHQTKGVSLQIAGPNSAIRGITIINAHDYAMLVSAAAVEMQSVTVSDSKVGIALSAGAKGFVVRTSVFERNETAITAEGSVRDVAILSSIFRDNSRAGFWFVGSAEGDSLPFKESVRIVDGVFEKNASGIVLANRPTLIQKCRFIANRESAVLILGGTAHVEDSEIRGSGGTGISVSSGKHVEILRNTLIDNPLTAIMSRDSEVVIDHNNLQHNGSGIVSISSQESQGTAIRENLIAKSTADGLTIIGGSPQIQKNQLVDNASAGIRVLDLVTSRASLKATPRLDGNIVKGNGIDLPPSGVYKLAGTLPSQ